MLAADSLVDIASSSFKADLVVQESKGGLGSHYVLVARHRSLVQAKYGLVAVDVFPECAPFERAGVAHHCARVVAEMRTFRGEELGYQLGLHGLSAPNSLVVLHTHK